MPASLVPNAKQYFPDINGNPLVGGFVYMYQSLTLIPKDTWKNSGQTVLNTNPVILDSRGQAVIYGVGDYRQIVTDADGNTIWDEEVSDYQSSVFGPQVSLPSHTTTDLGTATSNNVLITGTTTITSFGTSATLGNPIYFIQFSGILQLTYNAASMILPGAANITTAAGDSAMVEFTNALGYWRMISYFSGATGGAFGTAANQNIGTSGANVPLLNGNNTWSGTQAFSARTVGTPVALSVVAGAVSPNFALGNNFSVSISAGLTVNNPSNATAGQWGVIAVKQTAGSLTVSWGTAFVAQGGSATITLSGVNGATDYFPFYVNGASEIVIGALLNPTH
jgi:hypothetical protein